MDLHEDILMEIFVRLPAKSVGKFRCLSKTWSTNLSTFRFISLHLSIRKAKQPNLFLENKNYCFLYVSTLERATVSNKIKLTTTDWSAVVNSCNGLVLLLRKNLDMILVNPITMEHVIVPTPSSLELNELNIAASFNCGFGYDHSSDDYKVVVNFESRVDHSTIIQVYSVKSKAWKRVTSPDPPIFITGGGYRGVFTNGAIHWVSWNSRIVAINLADEVFYDIPFPTTNAKAYLCSHVIEGCLCVVDQSRQDIWIMKEYGVRDSWTKFTVTLNGKWDTFRPLCFIGDEEIVLLTYGDRVIVYNLVEGTSKDLLVDIDMTSYIDGVAFYDSLVPLN